MKKTTVSVLFTALVAASPAALANDGKACELTSPEELQSTIGAKVALKPSVLPNGVEVCTGKAGLSTVTIRLYPKKDDAERDKEEAKMDALEKAGATIEKRKFSKIECVELRPGGKATRQAYTTTCKTAATAKAPRYAVIEVTNPSQSLEMKKLAPLADNIAGRIF